MENYVICMEHCKPLITKIFLIKTPKRCNFTKKLKKLQKTHLWETIIYQNYIFSLKHFSNLLKRKKSFTECYVAIIITA